MSTSHAGAPLAVVDLGSNSFHLLIARARGASFETIEHLFDNVRLAAGVDACGHLDDAHRHHALATLSKFARHLTHFPVERMHAVATHAVRELRKPADFLRPAAAALGHHIDLISGAEEARLIWLGVVGALPAHAEQRLVIDIGGGSTEFILGHGQVMDDWHSASMGCVTAGVQCFPDGELSRARWQHCQEQLRYAMQSFATRFIDSGWQCAYATSGSAHAIASALTKLGFAGTEITAPALAQLRDRMLELGHVDRLAEQALAPSQHLVFAGGVAVMQAAFDCLHISRIQICQAAMREGMLWDLHQRVQGQNSAA